MIRVQEDRLNRRRCLEAFLRRSHPIFHPSPSAPPCSSPALRWWPPNFLLPSLANSAALRCSCSLPLSSKNYSMCSQYKRCSRSFAASITFIAGNLSASSIMFRREKTRFLRDLRMNHHPSLHLPRYNRCLMRVYVKVTKYRHPDIPPPPSNSDKT